MADILPAACCTAPPIVSDYIPTGHTLTITGRDDLPLSLYSTGPAAASKALICIYDIFGMAPNTLQGADVLAKLTGFRIVVPDFFRGRVWDHTNFPPKEGFASLQKWIGGVGEWNKVIRPDLEKVVAALREDGCSDVAVCFFHSVSYAGVAVVEDDHVDFGLLGLRILLWREESDRSDGGRSALQGDCNGPSFSHRAAGREWRQCACLPATEQWRGQEDHERLLGHYPEEAVRGEVLPQGLCTYSHPLRGSL
jgi:hypothetical protein